MLQWKAFFYDSDVKAKPPRTPQNKRQTDRRALLTRLSSAWMFSWQIKTLRRWNSLRGPISGLLHQLEESIRGNGAGWGARDRYLMIQSYLTSWHSLSSTHHHTPGTTSRGPFNGNKQENKGLMAVDDICVQKCSKSKWEMISRGILTGRSAVVDLDSLCFFARKQRDKGKSRNWLHLHHLTPSECQILS